MSDPFSSDDVRHAVADPAALELLRTATTHFTACCLLLDVGYALWGPSIPGVNANLIRAVDPRALVGCEFAPPGELLTGALPSASNVTNAWRNKDREEREVLRKYMRHASELMLRMRGEAEERPEREEQRCNLIKAMEGVSNQLEALEAVAQLRSDHVLMWQYMYTRMYKSFLKAVEDYQNAI